MDFVAIQDFVTPLVVATGQPHRPTQILKKKFQKGQIITGEIKTANGKPSFVLHKGTMMIPLSVIKQVITKDIQIGSDGTKSEIAKTNPKVEVKLVKTQDQKNKQYVDGVIVGAILGFGGVILAEKQGWIGVVDKKTRITGMVVGAIIGCYAVYRFKK
jgi:hypothetical protein